MFGGLAEQTDVDNLLAYLLTLSPNYVPADAAPTDISSSAATP